MKNNLIVKIAFAVALSLGFYVTVMGQKTGFAGDDDCVFLGDKDSESINLGKDPESDVMDPKGIAQLYFKWEIVDNPGGYGSLSETDTPKTVLTVTHNGSYVCKCSRISKYGYQTETVTITVYDEVNFSSITMADHIQCFPVGATLNESDFTIVTNPPGFEDRVELMPDYKVAKRSPWFSVGVESKETVRFHYRQFDGSYYVPNHNECEIIVVDDSKSFASMEVPIGKTLIDRMKTAKDYITKVKNTMENDKWLDGLKGQSPLFWNLDFNVTPYWSEECCDNKTKDVTVIDFSLALEGGVHWYFPLPVFPNFGFDLTIGVEGSAGVTGKRFNGCKPSGDINYSVGGSLVAKAMLTAVPGSDLLSASGGLKGYIKYSGTIPSSGGSVTAGISGVVDVVALVTIFSGEINIVEGTWPL